MLARPLRDDGMYAGRWIVVEVEVEGLGCGEFLMKSRGHGQANS
jgi:hypothetical protein